MLTCIGGGPRHVTVIGAVIQRQRVIATAGGDEAVGQILPRWWRRCRDPAPVAAVSSSAPPEATAIAADLAGDDKLKGGLGDDVLSDANGGERITRRGVLALRPGDGGQGAPVECLETANAGWTNFECGVTVPTLSGPKG